VVSKQRLKFMRTLRGRAAEDWANTTRAHWRLIEGSDCGATTVVMIGRNRLARLSRSGLCVTICELLS
jgi:hypothetical protein